MWHQQMLIEGVYVSEAKVPTKKMFSVYIDSSLIETIKKEAMKQSRKISAQTEVFLRSAMKEIGDDS